MKRHAAANLCLAVPPPPRARVDRRALTLTELIVSLFVGAVVLAVSVAAVAHAQRLRSQTVCAANLRNITLAFQSYTLDNGGVYPMPSTSAQWEDLLRVYVHRTTFRCPGDQELFPALGSSYDWRDTADPDTSLAGRMVTNVSRGNVSLTFDALPGWHQPRQVQVAYVDGSVRMVADEPFLVELQTPVSSPSP